MVSFARAVIRLTGHGCGIPIVLVDTHGHALALSDTVGQQCLERRGEADANFVGHTGGLLGDDLFIGKSWGTKQKGAQ
jgi:hypothetical protein